MPPPSSDELSLRHLPDISDASLSFSFQIPHVSKGDLLLGDDNDDDFFQNVNDSLATPGPSKTSHIPLTINELTPKPTSKSTAASEPNSIPASSSHDQPLGLRSKRVPQGIGRAVAPPTRVPETPKLKEDRPQTRVAEVSPVAVRFETLKAEVEMLDAESRESPKLGSSSSLPSHIKQSSGLPANPLDSKRERSIVKRKRTVFSGGISKPRSKPGPSSTSSFSRTVPSAPCYHPVQPLAEPTHHGESAEFDQNPDTSVCSTTSGGVAERLVMYSKKFITSFGDNISQPKSNPELGSPAAEMTTAVITSLGNQNNENDLFTLSQLSPHKPVFPSPKSPAASPASPMRQSTKRPVPVTSGRQSTKRSKTITIASSEGVADAPTLISTHGKSVPANHLSSSSRIRRTRAMTTNKIGIKNKKTTRQVSQTKSQNKDNRLASSSGSSSSTLRLSRTDNLTATESSAGPHPVGGSSSSAGDVGPIHTTEQRDKEVMLPLVNSTKGVEFRFELDVRMEARKGECEEGRRSVTRKQHRPVPDFKAMHALQEAELALRKENIMPVVPLRLELNTEHRAKEREKFNEFVREKEREMERAMEQRRKEREENEEREVRELRKKTVPRAHEVPEWYKDAPKRKSKDVDCIEE